MVFQVLGGLALFIFGMNIMTDGLREAAGQKLRSVLSVMTTRKLSGLGLGTLIATLVHSSATTVMVVGFINAGLMTLVQAIPVILGANIGTTLSMQAISFKLGDYALFAVTIGFIISMVAKNPKPKKIGLSLMGFGLLFLGMNLMSDAIKPHRELLKPIMASISGETTQRPGARHPDGHAAHLHHPEQRRHDRHGLRPRAGRRAHQRRADHAHHLRRPHRHLRHRPAGQHRHQHERQAARLCPPDLQHPQRHGRPPC